MVDKKDHEKDTEAEEEQLPGCTPTEEPSGKKTSRRTPTQAAVKATDSGWSVPVPMLGAVHLGTTEQLAYLGGIGVLAAVSVIEWPVAVVLVAGHVLTNQSRNKTLHAFGEALEHPETE